VLDIFKSNVLLGAGAEQQHSPILGTVSRKDPFYPFTNVSRGDGQWCAL
jgi:hypothetical protein